MLIALGDDELILGHRASEWCGHAPILEEDIAFANLALDEIGHAKLWYSALADLDGKDRDQYPDELVFWRETADFRNAQIVEHPNGDWAFSILRQYLFDSAEIERLKVLAESEIAPLAETASKIQVEELYHLRHSSAWVRRLALGTPESQRRMQTGLDQLWQYTAQLFALADDPEVLNNYGVNIGWAYQTWKEKVSKYLMESELKVPREGYSPVSRNEHTPHLDILVREMQSVAQLDPQAGW